MRELIAPLTIQTFIGMGDQKRDNGCGEVVKFEARAVGWIHSEEARSVVRLMAHLDGEKRQECRGSYLSCANLRGHNRARDENPAPAPKPEGALSMHNVPWSSDGRNRGVVSVLSEQTLRTILSKGIKTKIIVHIKNLPDTHTNSSLQVGKQKRSIWDMKVDDQGFHMARPGPIKWPCLSNLTPSSLSIRSFQSQWDSAKRFLDPGLCFSPQKPPSVRFEAMTLWQGINGAKGLFARAVPTNHTGTQ